METNKALSIISHLADGIDPLTGELFSPESPYNQPDIIRALYHAKVSLDKQLKQEQRKNNLPANAGKPWTMEEGKELLESFDSGMSYPDLAKKHKRTRGAIISRLEKAGRYEELKHSRRSK